MPNMDNGRQKVLDYLKENNLTIATLAVQYNMARQDVTNILNGKLKNPQAHRFVARVIEDFKIRQEVANMKPERYPYSGKRKGLERKAVNSVDIKACDIKSDGSSVTFSGSKVTIKGQSITGVD